MSEGETIESSTSEEKEKGKGRTGEEDRTRKRKYSWGDLWRFSLRRR